MCVCVIILFFAISVERERRKILFRRRASSRTNFGTFNFEICHSARFGGNREDPRDSDRETREDEMKGRREGGDENREG